MIGKFGYKFQNLLGSTYNNGDILFTPDSSTLIVPVGNRITCFDLLNNTTLTLPVEIRYNIEMLSLSEDGKILVAIDENGGIYFINYHMRVLFSVFNGLKGKATAFKFSPDSKLWAVAIGEKLKVYKTPSIIKQFNDIQKISDTAIGMDVINRIAWNPQSNVIATSSSDGNIRLYPIIYLKGFYEPRILSCGNKVVDFFFSSWKRIVVVTKKAFMIWQWKRSEEKKVEEKKLYQKSQDRRKRTKILNDKVGKWILFRKEHIKMDSPGVVIVGASPNLALDMVALSYSNGACKIVQLSSLQVMHELGQVHDQKKVESIEEYLTNDIASISLNQKGNWLAISHKVGSVVVWEWETKTFILKQQGHLSNVNAVAYSPDSSMVVSGGVDGKVKVWNTKTGHCFITFSDHTAAVNQVAFSPKGNAVFSASLDGTVRAYDLVRFRNFRILTTPKPTQFSCLGVDNAGEIICAGSNDNFGIFVWSLQTGKLLEILTGHIAPVSSVVFSPTDTLMVSGSWDKSTRVWDVFTGKGKVEILEHTSDVLSIAFKPDGKEICTANLRGVLTFWDPKEKELKGSIETLCDSWGGRVSKDIRSAKSRSFGRIFNSVSYSPNGNTVIACGNSIYVCIYNVEQKSLIRKFQITHNLSLDGVLDKLTTLNITESGHKDEIDHDEEYENENKLSFHELRLKKNQKELRKIPGVLNGVHSTGLINKKKILARSFQVSFSSTGRSWMCATSEGILLYSMDDSLMFDPYQLDINVTPQNLLLVLSKKQYMDALIMGLKLNVFEIIRHVFYNIPVVEIDYISQNFPFSYLDKFFTFLGQELESPQHIEVLLKWSTQLLQSHGKFLKENYLRYLPFFRVLHKNINSLKKDLSKVCDENTFNLSFLSHTHTLPVMVNSDLVSKEVGSSKSNNVVVHLDVLPPKRFNKRKTENKDKK